MTPRPFALASILAATLAAPSARAADAVDYVNHVAPILAANCAECHRPGQIGPMSLLSYDETRPWAKSIAKVVSERTMPPWFANPAHGKFRDAMVLNDEQIDTLVRWVAQGAPRGEGDAGALPEFRDNAWRMGTPDQIFAPAESFVVGDDVEDLYHNIVIPTGLTEDKWVIGTELIPGRADAVHHILVFIAPPGVDPSEIEGEGDDDNESEAAEARSERGERRGFGRGGENGDGERRGRRGGFGRGPGLFAKFGPGTNPEVFPDGRGRLLPAGSNIVFQMHYHKEPGPGTAVEDLSKMGVLYADGPVEHPMTTAWIAHPSFRIPAGAEDYSVRSVFKFIDDGHIYALTPHLHLRGKSFRYEAEYPDGTTEILLDVPKWDFNWQISYIMEEPKAIPRGTTIRATAHWDNSTNNPHNPDPTIDVTWGSPSTAEMMIGFMDYTYETKKKFQAQYGLPEMDSNPFMEIGKRLQRAREGREEREAGADGKS